MIKKYWFFVFLFLHVCVSAHAMEDAKQCGHSASNQKTLEDLNRESSKLLRQISDALDVLDNVYKSAITQEYKEIVLKNFNEQYNQLTLDYQKLGYEVSDIYSLKKISDGISAIEKHQRRRDKQDDKEKKQELVTIKDYINDLRRQVTKIETSEQVTQQLIHDFLECKNCEQFIRGRYFSDQERSKNMAFLLKFNMLASRIDALAELVRRKKII